MRGKEERAAKACKKHDEERGKTEEKRGGERREPNGKSHKKKGRFDFCGGL